MFISIYQELKAKRIIDKLSIANVSKVRVIRGGKEEEILPSEIVIDDLLKEGKAEAPEPLGEEVKVEEEE